jgi:hypothetical protein
MISRGNGSVSASPKTLAWLLEEDQPSVRYRTLTQLLDRPEDDPDVVAARREIPHKGWVAEILRERDPGGWWIAPESLYRPKYVSTNWRMLVLADLGASRDHPPVRKSAELWIARSALKGGGIGGNAAGSGHLCYTGNFARAIFQLGYGDDPRLVRAFEWLAEQADPKGGWSCFGSGRNLDSWEALSAFAVYPRDRWTPAMQESVARGCEFFLERELYRQGARYAPWYRFHYPVHYYYDLLVGLDLLTALGYGRDPRLGAALEVLRSRQRPDGRWALDAVHPDVEGAIATWFATHPKDRPTPWALEAVGAPSKMITLRALNVLRRVERAGPPPAPPPPIRPVRARSLRDSPPRPHVPARVRNQDRKPAGDRPGKRRRR